MFGKGEVVPVGGDQPHSQANGPECARVVWIVKASIDVKLTFVHPPGSDKPVADMPSKVHTFKAFYALASEMITRFNVLLIQLCSYVLSFLVPAILSRSRIQLAGSKSGGQA